MFYKHTQIGYLMIFAAIIVLILSAFALSQPDIFPFYPVAILAIIILILSFSTLQVTIDQKYLRFKFGYGLYRRKFEISEIISAKAVKNRWYYGWGIRYAIGLHLWIYNVSGFDAVEVEMKSGKKFRIGTDEPEKLEYAIMQAVKK